MRYLPSFTLGFVNGWIPLVLYLIGFIISVAIYPKETRVWLFHNPKEPGKKRLMIVRALGQIILLAYIVMMIFTQLDYKRPFAIAGAIVYIIGFIFVLSALRCFRLTPPNQPVVKGPYRLSRNPQWVGLFLVLLGAAVAAGIWLYVGMVAVVAIIYHLQIIDEERACLQKYGDSYRSYIEKIPRYLLF